MVVKRQDLKSYPFIVIVTLHRLVRIFLGVAPRNIEPPPPPPPCVLSRRRPAGARSARNAPHARADGASVRTCGDGMEGARRRSVRARSRTARRRVPPPARAPPSPQRRALLRPLFRVRDQRVVGFRVRRPRDHRHHRLVCERAANRDGACRRSVRRRSRTARETFRHRCQRRHHGVVLARRSVCKRCIVSKSECMRVNSKNKKGNVPSALVRDCRVVSSRVRPTAATTAPSASARPGHLQTMYS